MTTTTLKNPLDRAIQEAEERENARAELLREQAEERKIRQAEREAALRAEQEKARVIAAVRRFAEGFFAALYKHTSAKQWKPDAIRATKVYAEELLSRNDREFTKVDPSIERVVREKFVYGLILNNGKIPEGFLVGQRQEWFAPLFEQMKKAKAGQVRSR